MEISDPQWLAAFRLHRRQVDNYRHDRVFLAGDAAHIHSPAGGQGMNTGIQDAINLAWKLALVQQGHGNNALLESYNQERHAVGLSVLKLSDFLTRVNTTRNHIAQDVRNKIAPILAGQELIQQRMRDGVAELAINYRKSAIVAEHKVTLLKTQAIGHSDSDKPELFEWFEFDQRPQTRRPGTGCAFYRKTQRAHHATVRIVARHRAPTTVVCRCQNIGWWKYQPCRSSEFRYGQLERNKTACGGAQRYDVCPRAVDGLDSRRTSI